MWRSIDPLLSPEFLPASQFLIYIKVLVYQLKGMPEVPTHQEQTLERIVSASLASQLPEEEEGKDTADGAPDEENNEPEGNQ